jgi:hypothetical protein
MQSHRGNQRRSENQQNARYKDNGYYVYSVMLGVDVILSIKTSADFRNKAG